MGAGVHAVLEAVTGQRKKACVLLGKTSNGEWSFVAGWRECVARDSEGHCD